MGIFRGIFDKIKSGLSRTLTEAPRFIRGIADKIKSIPVIGTIAKTAYESLVPEGIRTGINATLEGAESLGKFIGGNKEPVKPNYPPPKPPSEGITKPSRPPPKPPTEITSSDLQKSREKLISPETYLRKPTGPLPMIPSNQEQLLQQIRARKKL